MHLTCFQLFLHYIINVVKSPFGRTLAAAPSAAPARAAPNNLMVECYAGGFRRAGVVNGLMKLKKKIAQSALAPTPPSFGAHPNTL